MRATRSRRKKTTAKEAVVRTAERSAALGGNPVLRSTNAQATRIAGKSRAPQRSSAATAIPAAGTSRALSLPPGKSSGAPFAATKYASATATDNAASRPTPRGGAAAASGAAIGATAGVGCAEGALIPTYGTSTPTEPHLWGLLSSASGLRISPEAILVAVRMFGAGRSRNHRRNTKRASGERK